MRGFEGKVNHENKPIGDKVEQSSQAPTVKVESEDNEVETWFQNELKTLLESQEVTSQYRNYDVTSNGNGNKEVK